MANTAKNRRTLFGTALGICAALALMTGFGILAGAGAAASSAKPVNTSPPTIKGTPEEGKVLTKDIGEWANNPTGYDGFWMRCNKNGGSCSDIKGGNNATYTLTSADVGNTIRLRVEATNADGTTSATSVPTAVITAAADLPTNTSPPTVSGTPQEGKTLSGKRGKWDGKPSDYNDYWVRCDKNGASCSDINGANKTTYQLTWLTSETRFDSRSARRTRPAGRSRPRCPPPWSAPRPGRCPRRRLRTAARAAVGRSTWRISARRRGC